MSAYREIQAAMRRNEHELMQHIRARAKAGRYGAYRPSGMLTPVAWWNALRRLEAAGRVKWSKVRGGYVPVA